MISKENIQSLVGNHVSPYIYNAKAFKPGETPIYYSGPYWDNKETEAAIDSFLNGRWITTGENVFKSGCNASNHKILAFFATCLILSCIYNLKI